MTKWLHGALACAMLLLASTPVLASYHGAAPADAGVIATLAWEVEHFIIHATLALSAVWEGAMAGSPWLAWHTLGSYAETCARDSLAAGFFFGSAFASLATLGLLVGGGLSCIFVGIRWLARQLHFRLAHA